MIALYKPTRSNKGCAISLQASDRDKSLFLNLIAQFGWDEAKKKGSFIENRKNPLKSTTLKLNQIEAASIVDSIEQNTAFKTVHSTSAKMTSISFLPGDETHPGFTLSVNQTNKEDTTKKASFFMPLSFGEARLIKEYLLHYLQKSFAINESREQQQSSEAQGAPATEEAPLQAQEAPLPSEPSQEAPPTNEEAKPW